MIISVKYVWIEGSDSGSWKEWFTKFDVELELIFFTMSIILFTLLCDCHISRRVGRSALFA